MTAAVTSQTITSFNKSTIDSSRQPVPDRIPQHLCSGVIFLSQVREDLFSSYTQGPHREAVQKKKNTRHKFYN